MELIRMLQEGLKIQNIPVKVIARDEASSRNRIYGIAAQGAIFIREDILRKGDVRQIAEALDHEARELSGVGHDDIRKEQYQGDLRALIR